MTATQKKKMPSVKPKIRGVSKVEGAEFVGPGERGSIYDPLMEKLGTLKVGEMVTVDIPEGVTPANYHSRLASVMSRRAPKPPKGCKFFKATLANQKQIAITCEEVN